MFVKYFKFILYIILVITMVYGYHPKYFNTEGESIYSYLHVFIPVILSIIITSINKFKCIKYIKFISTYAITALIISITCLLLYSFDLIDGLSEIRSISIPLIGIVIGSISRFNDKQLDILIFIYIIFVVYICSLQITTNVGSFQIMEMYLVNAKNSIGPITCIAGLLALLNVTCSRYSIFYKIFMFGLYIITFYEIVTIRARLSMIIFIILSGLIIAKSIKQQRRINLLTIIMLVSILVVLITQEVVSDYITNSFYANREDDITSGRIEGYAEGVNTFLNNPLFGNLFEQNDIEWIHNYPLLILSSYGIIIGIPWLFLYLYITYQTIKRYINVNIFANYNYGIIALSVLLLTSLGEPSFPYSPGTAVFFPFLLMGISLYRNNSNNTLYEH